MRCFAIKAYKKNFSLATMLLGFFLLLGCTPELPNAANVTPVTAVPTLDSPSLCDIVITSSDWLIHLDALKTIYLRGDNCGSDIALQLYVAYLSYGDFLEATGDVDAALVAYQDALRYLPNGREAQERVARLGNQAETVSEQCEDGTEAETVPRYDASEGSFATLTNTGFLVDGEQYLIYGVNYYPRDTPFWHFLTETDLDSVGTELTLIRPTGLNTLRIFLRYQDLFACDALVPIAENFLRLDGLIQLAAENDFRLIIVLHQDADAVVLYRNLPYQRAQSRFIIERYKDEPAILAWDVRDRGDYDYRDGGIARVDVLRWVADETLLIRSIDTNHFVTAGWWQDAIDTIPLVDFVSFQFYGEYASLRQEVANLRAASNKPILLTAVGYSTFTLDEIAQRNLLYQAFEEVTNNGFMGWIVYMAFDYPRTATCIEPDCPGSGNVLDHYGLWNTSYFPKLAVDAIRVSTGQAED